ncbi:MAG: hypothetical protein ABIA66_01215 [Candidatus Omnitrophota bacterium]
MEFIIKGGPTHKPHKANLESKTKDELHRRRKELTEELKGRLFTKDQMNWRDCRDRDAECKRVSDYMKLQKINEPKMKEWSDINREFKKRGEEGRLHSIDDLRRRKSVKYD